MNKRGRITISIIAVALCVLTLGLYGVLTAEEYDPTTFEVGLHRTDLLIDQFDMTPVNVFDGVGTATTIDLVSNPGDAFGEGDVPTGTYNRMKLTMANLVSVAGTDPCDLSAYTGTFLIDDVLAPDAPVEVFYATAEDGGDSMILADGSAATPFLMMSPIVVEPGETTVVNLAFYTSGSLVCNGGPPGGTVELRPPSLTVATYIEGEPLVVDPSGEYWFAHFNVNGHLYDEQTGDWFDPESAAVPHDLLDRINAGTGWGSLTLGAPDTVSGIGSWSIANASWRSGGFGEHRHSFSRWDTSSDEGYAETAPNLPLTGSYQLTGNRIFLKIGSSAAMEGYIAVDGRSFILVNIAGVDDSDVVLAVKKASGYPSDVPEGTYVIVSPQMDFRYDTSGTSPYPATKMGLSGEIIVLRGGTDDDFFSWGTNLELDYGYKGDTIFSIFGQVPEEGSEYQAGAISALAFDSSGFATTSPESNTMFLAMGGDGATGYLGLFAGLGAEDDDGEHRLANGFIVEADPSPSLSDLTGRWALMGVNWEGNQGDDATWDTGDEGFELLTTLGLIEFDGTGGITWDFTDKDVITQAITSEIGSGSVSLATEYYELGNPIGSFSEDAIPLTLFHVTESASSSTVAAKLVLDKGGDTVLFWSPIDSGNIPQDGSTEDAASRFTMGAAVRIE